MFIKSYHNINMSIINVYKVLWLICNIVTLVQVILCTIQRTQNNVPYTQGNRRMFGCWYVILCSRPYTVHYFVFVVLYTQSLVLMLQYYISTTKHSTVPVFIRYIILVCTIQRTQNNVLYKHGNSRMFSCWYVILEH
jgi:uncharacterized membrane protein